jgi:Tol biopolymer transport system component
MKPITLAIRLTFMLCLVAFGLTAGCNQKKINKTNPALLTTVRVSMASDGTEGNLDAVPDTPGVSNDGRYIAFTSRAFNLIPNNFDTNGFQDVFLRDNLNRSLVMVSVSLGGGPANGASGQPSVSGDGRYVAFSSTATNLVATVVPAGVRQIYVRDMTGDGVTPPQTYLVSRATGATGLIADDECRNPKISNDGIFIAFESKSNLLDGVNGGGDDNETPTALFDVYRRKWIDGTSTFPTELISIRSTFAMGANEKGNSSSTNPSISADGRYVAFDSGSSNLVDVNQDGAPDNNGTTDVFVRDCQTNRTVRCSVEFAGHDPLLVSQSGAPAISLDGQLVCFRSLSGALHATAQEQGTPNIFVRSWNVAVPFTEVLSVHSSGATGGASCNRPTISGDGSKIAWQSGSSALVNGDSNSAEDIFLRDRVSQSTSRESVQTFGGQLDGLSNAAIYSPDGRYIIFWSKATNVVDDDDNGAADIFMRGPPFK